MCDRNGPLCQPHPLCPLSGFAVKMKDRSSEIIIEYLDLLPADFTYTAAKSLGNRFLGRKTPGQMLVVPGAIV